MVLWLPFGVCGSRLVEGERAAHQSTRGAQGGRRRLARTTAAHVDIVSSPLGTGCRIARDTAHDYGPLKRMIDVHRDSACSNIWKALVYLQFRRILLVEWAYSLLAVFTRGAAGTSGRRSDR